MSMVYCDCRGIDENCPKCRGLGVHPKREQLVRVDESGGPCSMCGGTGVMDPYEDDETEECPECLGTGFEDEDEHGR